MLFVGAILIASGLCIIGLELAFDLPGIISSEIFGVQYSFIIGAFLIIVGILLIQKCLKN